MPQPFAFAFVLTFCYIIPVNQKLFNPTYDLSSCSQDRISPQ